MDEEHKEAVGYLGEKQRGFATKRENFLPFDVLSSSRAEPSTEKPPILEIKLLPSHLKYAYLGDSSLHVIIFSYLIGVEEEKLIRVLREHKRVIGWGIAIIQEISPSICMHKILMGEGYKPMVQPQRRLNPNLQEVEKKEVIKWLDSGIIFPISDSF